MGYTHYWKSKPDSDNAIRQELYAEALDEIAQIVKNSPVPLAGPHGEGQPEIDEMGIAFNGCAPEMDYESFVLPADANDIDAFEFCKTACKPYDIVVVAALMILADRCKWIQVSSDGDAEDLAPGRALASRVLRRVVGNFATA